MHTNSTRHTCTELRVTRGHVTALQQADAASQITRWLMHWTARILNYLSLP